MNFKFFLLSIYAFCSLIVAIILMYLFRSKTHTFRKVWAYTMIKLIGVNIVEVGKLDTEADVIAMNHNSMLDVILFDYLHTRDIAWVANVKLSKIPLFGHIFTIPKLILIDPTKKSSLKTLFVKTKDEVGKGRPIGIFPEGTRGDTNDMAKFVMGTKMLVKKLNLSIQPIILVNTRQRLDTKTYTSSPGKVKIIYLDTIHPSNLEEEWYETLYLEMKKRYEAEKSIVDI